MTSGPNSTPQGNDPASISLATSDHSLRVEFRWQYDRFVQSLFCDDIEPTCQSVEGSGEETWPPSPPVQQLSMEKINGQDVVLGVGAAGQSHWSISVETCQVDQAAALKFDLACRCRSTPTWLGSTYRLDPRLRIEPLGSSIIERGDQGESIRPGSLDGKSTFRWSYLMILRQPLQQNP